MEERQIVSIRGGDMTTHEITSATIGAHQYLNPGECSRMLTWKVLGLSSRLCVPEHKFACCTHVHGFRLIPQLIPLAVNLALAEEDLAAVVIQPEKGRLSFSSLMKTSEDVKRFFAKWYPGTFGAEGPSPEIVQDFLDLRCGYMRKDHARLEQWW